MPWLALFRPAAAARRLSNLPAGTFAAWGLGWLFICAAILILLQLWDATVTAQWAASAGPQDVEWTVTRNAIDEIWRRWHATGPVGIPLLTILLTFAIGIASLCFLAWLNLPFIHRTGPVWSAYQTSCRATAIVLCPVTITILLTGLTYVPMNHAFLRGTADTYISSPYLGPDAVIRLGVTLGVWWLIALLGVSARAAARTQPTPQLPPRCESCGYDLTHQPASARCPECGLSLHAALAVDTRGTTPWSTRYSVKNWRLASSQLLFHSQRFYRYLAVRHDPAAASRFARWHFLLIWCGAFVWIGVMGVLTAPWLDIEMLLTFLSITAIGTAVCWFGQRTIGATVTSWWLARRTLPDTRYAAHIIHYESVFVWVFCIYWGCMFTLISLGSLFVTVLNVFIPIPFLAPSGIPLGPLLLFTGTLALGLLWLLRYRRAAYAVCWSNR